MVQYQIQTASIRNKGRERQYDESSGSAGSTPVLLLLSFGNMQDGAEEESVLDSMSKRELTLLWNALGLSARHQAQELDHLRRDLRQVVTAKLQYVRTACDRFMQDIEVLQQEVQALRQQLYRDEEQRSSQQVSTCVSDLTTRAWYSDRRLLQYDLDTSGALIDRLVALTVERDCLRKVRRVPVIHLALFVWLTTISDPRASAVDAEGTKRKNRSDFSFAR